VQEEHKQELGHVLTPRLLEAVRNVVVVVAIHALKRNRQAVTPIPVQSMEITLRGANGVIAAKLVKMMLLG